MNEVPHPGFDKPGKNETTATSNDLEEAAWGYASKECEKSAYIAGAKWQKQHDAELIEIAYNDGITIGMAKQKEQMLKESVEGYISFNANAREEGLPYITAIADEKPLEFYEKRGFKLGERVRIIIVKEGEI